MARQRVTGDVTLGEAPGFDVGGSIVIFLSPVNSADTRVAEAQMVGADALTGQVPIPLLFPRPCPASSAPSPALPCGVSLQRSWPPHEPLTRYSGRHSTTYTAFWWDKAYKIGQHFTQNAVYVSEVAPD
jgi:hypothetical protein